MEDYNIEFEIDSESQKKYLSCLIRRTKNPLIASNRTSRNAGKKQSTINFSYTKIHQSKLFRSSKAYSCTDAMSAGMAATSFMKV